MATPVPHTVDVVVLGTGAAGLTAAVAAHDAGASVALFEKADVVGGTTALSGGVAWLPNNPVAAAAGVQDSREEALAYLRSLSNGLFLDDLVESFVDTVPELTRWLQDTVGMPLLLCTIPDYHPEHPGGKQGSGRSLEPAHFAFDQLGPWADKVAAGQYSDPVTGDSYLITGESPRAGGSGIVAPDVLAERRRRRINGRGRALVGGLLKACLDRGIVPTTTARAQRLLMDSGRVAGVTIAHGGQVHEVRARRGVVLATGGFEWDRELVQAFLRGPMEHPPTLPTNTGDGLRMAMRVGAMLGTMREAWWVPVMKIPHQTRLGVQRVSLVLRERSLPGAILVNRRGRRFCNEATNYNALAGAFHQFDPVQFRYGNLPCWLVFDQAYVDRYGFWEIPPGGPVPDWVRQHATVAGLSQALELPPGALEQTLTQWNQDVAEGRDTLFGRGDSAYDGWNGDIAHYPSRTSTLGPITQGPFYAVELHSSALGTKGGPRTTVDGEVLDVDGATIPGLYAAGNAMAGPTGMAYGGAGGTLGPALVFGYRAGRHAGAVR